MDRYSKTVLTIIAVSLICIAFKDTNLISNALASTGVVEVKVVSMNLPIYKPIPVRVQGEIRCVDNQN